MSQNPEIVITGMGVVSPIGIGIDSFWENLCNGNSGVRVREGFENFHSNASLAAPVSDFEPKKYVKPRKSLKVMCRQIQFGYAAATMAVESAGIEKGTIDPDRIATVFGGETYYANPEELQSVFRKCKEKGGDEKAWGQVAMKEVEPLWMLKYLPNMVASHISIMIDARGPSNCVVQSECSSLLAFMEGVDLLHRGWADAAVVGATGSELSPNAMIYRGLERFSRNVENPEQAVRPFDANRDGTVAGEGAGAFVIETKESAQNRGAKILANVKGFDRRFGTREQRADQIAASISGSLKNSNLSADQIGHINASACGEVSFDQIEAQGISKAGMSDTLTFAPKSYFGNLGPATGSIELACSVLALQKDVLPGTKNFQSAGSDCPVKVSAESSKPVSESALILSQNSTGQITSLVIEK